MTETARRLVGLRGARVFAAAADLTDDGRGVLETPATAFLIDHEQGNVLIDTGLDPLAVGAGAETVYAHLKPAVRIDYPPDRLIQYQLALAGVRLSDIDHVVIGHGHFAHTGGLDLFPSATVHIQQAERQAVQAALESGGPASIYRDFLRVSRARWAEHDADADLLGDGAIMILAAPGHTPGTCAVMVRLTGRTVLLTGVTASTREAFEQERTAPHDWDREQALRSIRRLKQIAADSAAEIWVGHDPDDRHWHTAVDGVSRALASIVQGF